MCKLFEYIFWRNCLEFIDRMDLTIQMRISNKLEHRHVICFKFGDIFFTSLIMLVLEWNTSICSAIKENPISYCRKFSAFVVVAKN